MRAENADKALMEKQVRVEFIQAEVEDLQRENDFLRMKLERVVEQREREPHPEDEEEGEVAPLFEDVLVGD